MKFKIPSLPLSKTQAVKIYLKHGGVLKQEGDKLIYPDKLKINQQLELIDKKINYLSPLIKELKEKQRDLSLFNVVNFFKRTRDSLFWKHYLRKLMDEDYRQASKAVSPPINRINEDKYRKILEQFIENEDYRKSMYEAKTSIINEQTLSESIEKNIKESKKLVKLRLNKLKKEKEIAVEKKKALETFLNWVD